MHELEAELVLQAAEALAHARLRETEPIGGAAEGKLFRQGKEHPDLAQLDRLPHREATLLAPLRGRQLIAASAARILGPCLHGGSSCDGLGGGPRLDDVAGGSMR